MKFHRSVEETSELKFSKTRFGWTSSKNKCLVLYQKNDFKDLWAQKE